MPTFSMPNERNYGNEGQCAYNDCKQEPMWTRLADQAGPGLVFVCSMHKDSEGTYTDMLAGSNYTPIHRDPEESQAVIAHLLKVVSRG